MKEFDSKIFQLRRFPLPALLGVFGGAVIGLYLFNKYRETKSNESSSSRPHEEQEVDTSSEDSFPASDPPSWSSGHEAVWH